MIKFCTNCRLLYYDKTHSMDCCTYCEVDTYDYSIHHNLELLSKEEIKKILGISNLDNTSEIAPT